jgi:hypothetical protein
LKLSNISKDLWSSIGFLFFSKSLLARYRGFDSSWSAICKSFSFYLFTSSSLSLI